MTPDTDRYYTPPELATTVVASLASTKVAKCIDTACGCGNLLAAVQERYPQVKCFGMDIDEATVRRVRQDNPTWIVSVADILNPASVRRTRVFGALTGADVAVLNPPFSLGDQKGLLIGDSEGSARRCGRAMAHILEVMRTLPPKREFVAIVPESLMHSEMDTWGREWLREYWDVQTVSGVKNSTFTGARANCLVVHGHNKCSSNLEPRIVPVQLPQCSLTRGGLPVHTAIDKKYGIPYVHSTDLQNVALGRLDTLRRVPRGGSAVVDGHAILLPRVGLPLRKYIAARRFDQKIQLSDCVIALTFRKHADAVKASEIIRAEYDALCGLYRGTGARYVTVERLRQWSGGTVTRKGP